MHAKRQFGVDWLQTEPAHHSVLALKFDLVSQCRNEPPGTLETAPALKPVEINSTWNERWRSEAVKVTHVTRAITVSRTKKAILSPGFQEIWHFSWFTERELKEMGVKRSHHHDVKLRDGSFKKRWKSGYLSQKYFPKLISYRRNGFIAQII